MGGAANLAMSGRILIAGGAATRLHDLAGRLRSAYLDVTDVPDGRAALALAREQEPDLVVADARCAGLPGLHLCRALKADPGLAHLPVVIIAEREARAERLAGLEAGADDFLAPPFDDAALLARLRNLMRMKAMVDELRLREETARALGLPASPEPGPDAPGFPVRGLMLAVLPEPVSARRRAAQLCAALGIQCRPATDAARALALADETPPDLVLVEPGEGEAAIEAALRLVSALRARPATRGAGMVLVLPPSAGSAASLALDLGADDCVTAPPDLAELAARLRTLLRRKRFSDRLRDAVRDGLMLAATDPLTGLFNRRYAETHLARMLDQCARAGEPLAVMMLDLDRFKRINDHHGHAAGDAVLRGFAERLKAEVRGADLVARLGGEEFCVAMPGADEGEAGRAAERVRAAVARRPFAAPDGVSIPVTVSIGVAVMPPAGLPLASLAPTAAALTASMRPADTMTGGSARAFADGLAEPAAAFLRPRSPCAAAAAPGGAIRRPSTTGTIPDGAALLARADHALYASKADGRDRVSLVRLG